VGHYTNASYAGCDMIDLLMAETRKITTWPSRSKIQTDLLWMVYDAITRSPDSDWTTYLAIVLERCVNNALEMFGQQVYFDCSSRMQTQNWFAKAREEEKNLAIRRIGAPILFDVVDVLCDRRLVKVHRSAFQSCPTHLWSDEYFGAVLCVHLRSLQELEEMQNRQNRMVTISRF
jgi:hypothetical protein